MSGNGSAGTGGWCGAAAEDRLPEVACDESGPDGGNPVGGNTGVFAHAGVALPVDVAA
ncbi:hypothetical protein ABZ299_29425 [Streptomyces sp. NPDC006184]|uniref:hypothetical protein n=1 Tax=Streptomyces sp. NPDC006184 TaxID=3155455 RepID=UPI0033B8697C